MRSHLQNRRFLDAVEEVEGVERHCNLIEIVFQFPLVYVHLAPWTPKGMQLSNWSLSRLAVPTT